jgi:hypothetical protein
MAEISTLPLGLDLPARFPQYASGAMVAQGHVQNGIFFGLD